MPCPGSRSSVPKDQAGSAHEEDSGPPWDLKSNKAVSLTRLRVFLLALQRKASVKRQMLPSREQGDTGSRQHSGKGRMDKSSFLYR